MKKLTHINESGDAQIVDVGEKPIVARVAVAEGSILLADETLELIRNESIKKGSVLTVAKVAGIMAVKKTSELIPLCHPIPIERIDLEFAIHKGVIKATCTVGCFARTGVEMEALNGVSAALLTIYDMCKAVDKQMVIREIKLISKWKEI